MGDSEVHIIPLPGNPMEYDTRKSSRTIFISPKQGFLVGPENYILESVVQWSLDDELPRDRFPILFYGPSGCGKTHLLQGLYETWRRSQDEGTPKKRGLLLSAGDFARLYADAAETRTTDNFQRRFRGTAMLMLDNLELIRNKPAVQDELRHTLDTLSRNGGTAVLAMNGFPDEGQCFSEALKSRLLGGTTVPILLPGHAVRKRFIAELVSAFRLNLPVSAIAEAANELPVSLPSLHGIFSQLDFEAAAEDVEFNAGYLKRFLRQHTRENRPTIAAIVKRTAIHFSLKPADLRGESRNKTVALARSIAAYLARQQTGLPMKEIAKYLGNRDPSTIRHLVSRIQNELSSDVVLRDHLFRLGTKD